MWMRKLVKILCVLCVVINISSCNFIDTIDNKVYIVVRKFDDTGENKNFTKIKLKNIISKMKDCKVFEYSTEKMKAGFFDEAHKIYDRKTIKYDMKLSSYTINDLLKEQGIDLEQFIGKSYVEIDADGFEKYRYENVMSDSSVEYYTMFIRNDKIDSVNIYKVDRDSMLRNYITYKYYNIKYR